MSKVITEPSICIPRTLNNVGWREVKDTFEELFGKGTIDRVDIVPVRNADKPMCKIFIHFRYWPTDEASMGYRESLLKGDTLKVWHDYPRFWKCWASNVAKPDRNTPKVAPYMEVAKTVKPEGSCFGEMGEMEEMTDAMLKDDIVEQT